MEEVVFEVEAIGEAVRRIDAHDERAVAKVGEFHAGGRGEAGLPYPTLTGEHKNAHGSIIRPRRFLIIGVPSSSFGQAGA